MSYYGSFVIQCYVLRMRVMTSTVGGNLTNRPPAVRHIHVNKQIKKSYILLAVIWNYSGEYKYEFMVELY